jgi:hypothetical protein
VNKLSTLWSNSTVTGRESSQNKIIAKQNHHKTKASQNKIIAKQNHRKTESSQNRIIAKRKHRKPESSQNKIIAKQKHRKTESSQNKIISTLVLPQLFPLVRVHGTSLRARDRSA